MNIRSLQLENPFFLAPMEAVNCTSFRMLCKKRGASLVYTDMIDADIFMEFINENGADEKAKKEAIKKFINPNSEEKPLAIQLGGAKAETLEQTMKILEPYADLFDFNAGCPLPYMLGKKGGVFLMKHPDQLYKVITHLRSVTTKPFTVKLRSGWDEQSINALEVAKELEKIGVDAITIHARTRKQKYEKKSDWQLVKKIKEELKIPIILSGDVTNTYLAHMAFMHTKCDFIMLGRGAKNNPSIFQDLNNYWQTKRQPQKPQKTYDKNRDQVRRDFKYFMELYSRVENRDKLSEVKDHALWLATDCLDNKEITQKILTAGSKVHLHKVFNQVRF